MNGAFYRLQLIHLTLSVSRRKHEATCHLPPAKLFLSALLSIGLIGCSSGSGNSGGGITPPSPKPTSSLNLSSQGLLESSSVTLTYSIADEEHSLRVEGKSSNTFSLNLAKELPAGTPYKVQITRTSQPDFAALGIENAKLSGISSSSYHGAWLQSCSLPNANANGLMEGTVGADINGTIDISLSCETLLYFSDGNSIWRTNGHVGNLQRIESDAPLGETGELIILNDKLYFFSKLKLWVTDGTKAGTHQVKSDEVTGYPYVVNNLTVMDNKLYFRARDSNMSADDEFWVSDGTTSGTKMLKDINSADESRPYGFALLNNQLYFAAYSSSGASIWATDGTEEGTQQKVSSNTLEAYENANGQYGPNFLVNVNNELYFPLARTNFYKLGDDDSITAFTPADGTSYAETSFEGVDVLNGKLYFRAKINDNDSDWVTLTTSDQNPTQTFALGKKIAMLGSKNGEVYYLEVKQWPEPSVLWKTDGRTQDAQGNLKTKIDSIKIGELN